VPQDSEVAELLEVPVALFLRDESRDQELWEWRDILLEVPFYRIDEHKVWGATAMMLSEFAERLRLQNGEFTGT
jgi:cytochrome c oxidase assembly protein Cox11